MFILLIIVLALFLIDYKLALGLLNVGAGFAIGFVLGSYLCFLGVQSLLNLI